MRFVELVMREAAAIYHRRLGGEHQALGNALNGLARVLYGERKFAEAEIQARASAAIRDKTTPDHWSRFDTHSLIGLTLLAQRRVRGTPSRRCCPGTRA